MITPLEAYNEFLHNDAPALDFETPHVCAAHPYVQLQQSDERCYECAHERDEMISTRNETRRARREQRR